MGSIFIKATRNGQDYLARYEGMDQATVTGLLSEMGCSGVQYLTLDAYQQLLKAIPVPPPPVPVDLTSKQTALAGAISADPKLAALIALLQAKGLI